MRRLSLDSGVCGGSRATDWGCSVRSERHPDRCCPQQGHHGAHSPLRAIFPLGDRYCRLSWSGCTATSFRLGSSPTPAASPKTSTFWGESPSRSSRPPRLTLHRYYFHFFGALPDMVRRFLLRAVVALVLPHDRWRSRESSSAWSKTLRWLAPTSPRASRLRRQCRWCGSPSPRYTPCPHAPTSIWEWLTLICRVQVFQSILFCQEGAPIGADRDLEAEYDDLSFDEWASLNDRNRNNVLSRLHHKTQRACQEHIRHPFHRAVSPCNSSLQFRSAITDLYFRWRGRRLVPSLTMLASEALCTGSPKVLSGNSLRLT